MIPGTIRLEGLSMEYVGFWRRFGAFWLDFLVLLPLTALIIWGSGQWRLFDLYYFIPGILIGLWFHVYLVKRYGGTPGKLLLNIRITKLDGNSVGYREALLRHSVLLVLGTAMSVALIPVTLGMTDAQYFSMNWQTRAVYITEQAAAWYKPLYYASQIWIWSEFIVLLTNKKRRAIHDFIAGTVVIRKPA